MFRRTKHFVHRPTGIVMKLKKVNPRRYEGYMYSDDVEFVFDNPRGVVASWLDYKYDEKCKIILNLDEKRETLKSFGIYDLWS